MTIQQIQFEDKKYLEKLVFFLEENEEGLKHFRYFKNRNLECLKNHLSTFLFLEEEKTIGYGHLDREGDNVWLGIMVDKNYQGRGIGKKIMLFLIGFYDGDIKLSVDKENTKAFDLYIKVGFTIFEENERNYIMKLIR
jgi:ribosomal protein S18 acetylase RimI-like enzyme